MFLSTVLYMHTNDPIHPLWHSKSASGTSSVGEAFPKAQRARVRDRSDSPPNPPPPHNGQRAPAIVASDSGEPPLLNTNSDNHEQPPAGASGRPDRPGKAPLLSKNERKMLFIHVGKTGGTTIQGFWRKNRKTSELARQIDDMVHCNQPKGIKNYTSFNSFLVSVRDPIDRFASFFLYGHPKNSRIFTQGSWAGNPHLREFYGCYEQLDYLATNGLAETVNASAAEEACAALAKDVVAGRAGRKEGYYAHITWNYEWYLADPLSRKDREFFVLRTEYLWDDIDRLNDMLGGGPVERTRTVSYRKKKGRPPVFNRTLSSDGMNNLCRTLCRDIQAYKEVLLCARNMDDESLNVTMGQLAEKCPTEAARSACPNEAPSTSRM